MNLATNDDENMNKCIRECNEMILSTILQEFKSRAQAAPSTVSHDGALRDIGDKLDRVCKKLDEFTTVHDALLTGLATIVSARVEARLIAATTSSS